jgi:hypothetical protein
MQGDPEELGALGHPELGISPSLVILSLKLIAATVFHEGFYASLKRGGGDLSTNN